MVEMRAKGIEGALESTSGSVLLISSELDPTELWAMNKVLFPLTVGVQMVVAKRTPYPLP